MSSSFSTTSRRFDPVRALFALVLLAAAFGASARTLPHPLVLMHGLGETTERWKSLEPGFEERGWIAGGVVRAPYAKDQADGLGADADYYYIEINDSNAGLHSQADALAGALEGLAQLTGEDRFVVIGFSLGGVIARAHAVRHPGRHRIVELVTLGSPHQGSDWAYLYELFAPVKEQCATPGTGLEGLLLAPMCLLIEGFEDRLGVRLDAPILRDLAPPEYDAQGRPTNPLADLALAAHPTDVRYVSVVGEVAAPKDASELEQALQGLSRELENGDLGMTENKARILALVKGVLGHLLDHPAYLESGDGAVTAASQDLSRLPWFAGRIRGVEDTAWKHGATVSYRLDGVTAPLRVEYVQAAHLAQTRSPEVLFRAIAGLPSLALSDQPAVTGTSRADVRGQVDDLLFDPRSLSVLRKSDAGLATLDIEARSAGDGRSFEFADVPIDPGTNTLVVRYGPDHVPAPFPLEATFTVERRTGPLAPLLQRPWLSAGMLVLIIILVMRWTRREA